MDEDRRRAYYATEQGSSPLTVAVQVCALPAGLMLLNYAQRSPAGLQAVYITALGLVPLLQPQAAFLIVALGLFLLLLHSTQPKRSAESSTSVAYLVLTAAFERQNHSHRTRTTPQNLLAAVAEYCTIKTTSQTAAQPRRLHWLDLCRGGTMLTISFAILAVDFPLFPRYAVKTRLYGYSIMDVGVGALIYGQGLVGGYRQSRLVAAVLPLFLLGAVRWLAVRMAGYPEVAEEYGRDWNFFWTMAVVQTVAWPITCRLQVRQERVCDSSPTCLGIALAIATGAAVGAWQMFVLGQAKWLTYVESAPRDQSFLTANREGLLSLPGFLCLYLLAASAALVRPLGQKSRWPAAISWLLLWWLASNAFGAPSRRLCNLTFVLWAAALYELAACLYQLVARWTWSMSLQAVNRHQLLVFLLANLLTGAVNMLAAPPMVSSVAASVVILMAYGTCLLLAAHTLKSIKWWE